MNRVCKDGKLYGYNVANGKLFDLTTYKAIDEEKIAYKTIEAEKCEEVKEVKKEMVEEKAKFATKFKKK